MENEKFKLVLFLLYTILYEVMVWGLVSYSIVVLKWEWYIMFLGIFMSSAQLRPIHFGLDYLKDRD